MQLVIHLIVQVYARIASYIDTCLLCYVYLLVFVLNDLLILTFYWFVQRETCDEMDKNFCIDLGMTNI